MILRIPVRRLVAIVISCGFMQSANAEPILNPANGHYYEAFVISGGINWGDANAAASSMSYLGIHGHLATSTSAEENQFLEDYLNIGKQPVPGWFSISSG